LLFHNGQPVTTDDVIASLNRWSQTDAWGKTIFDNLDSMSKVDARTFTMKLKQPYGLLTKALGKPGSPMPVIMPKEQAATPSKTPVNAPIGSGPFKLVEWKPGRHLILEKFKDYKPRPEPASGFAGGKIAYVDRLEFLEVPDVATQLAALATGELHVIPEVAHDQVAQVRKNPETEARGIMPTIMEMLMFNKARPPFNNVKVRQAIQTAVNNAAVMRLAVGHDEFFRVTPSVFFEGTAFESKAGMEYFNQVNMEKGKALLKEAGGAPGKPVIMIVAKEFPHHYNAALALKQELEQLGFKIDFQVYDWSTIVAMRNNKDKWDIFAGGLSFASNAEPATALWMNPKWMGWYESPRIEDLSKKYFVAKTLAEQKKIVDQIQAVFYEDVPFVKLGEMAYVCANRKEVKGFPKTEDPVFWNVWLDK
jgi:peptide/nickel transport system substrate-binding protein